MKFEYDFENAQHRHKEFSININSDIHTHAYIQTDIL